MRKIAQKTCRNSAGMPHRVQQRNRQAISGDEREAVHFRASGSMENRPRTAPVQKYGMKYCYAAAWLILICTALSRMEIR